MRETPFTRIQSELAGELPGITIEQLPDKWEKIGDVLLLKLPVDLKKYQEKIGEIYARVLHCKSVLQDTGGISGTYRMPTVELIYGSENTETVHVENGIRYKLDPQKLMFSSGNMNERIRMSTVSNSKESVVDLFAGIGYFTLPLAVYSRPKRVYACEVNTVAYEYLCQNIRLNNVLECVEPILGDNRKNAPKGVADRVIMGFLHDTYLFLPTAFDCLKNTKGTLHYHEVIPDELLPERPLEMIKDAVKAYGRRMRVKEWRKVKSYAPGVSHAVFDLEIM